MHTPFPSSEIYRTLPVREELLRSVLKADLIGARPRPLALSPTLCVCLGVEVGGWVGDVGVFGGVMGGGRPGSEGEGKG